MARVSFADLVMSTGVNYKIEYKMLLTLLQGSAYRIFHDNELKGDIFGGSGEVRSFTDFCDEHFEKFPIRLRGTCRTLSVFNQYHNYYPDSIDEPGLDDLLTLCEYSMTFSCALQVVINKDGYYRREKIVNSHIIQHLKILVDKLHHKVVAEGPFARLVPEDVVVAEVASKLPKDVSIKTFIYRHRLMAGNIEKKKDVLLALGQQLESKRSDIRDSALENAIFAILNNMNIRHNNVDPKDPAKYHAFVAAMSPKDLEVWYDRLYEMMLAAFAKLDAAQGIALYEANKKAISS